MPNPSSASASSSDRQTVASDLYIAGGASNASTRCDLNTALGELNLGAEILARLGLQPSETILDIACGTGQHLERYREAVALTGAARGYDFNPEAIAKALARGLHATVSTAWELPEPDAVADALTCNYAIYYFDDITRTLSEWARVLKAGGRLLLSGPAAANNDDFYAFHKDATGSDPSDADVMALGFISRVVPPALPAAGFTLISNETLTNPIRFPDAETYLDYWVATSLFRRTPGATREQGAALLAREPARPLVVTKRVSVLMAQRD